MKTKLELKNILPEKSYVGEDIIIENKRDYILVYYITKYPTGQPKTKKFQPAKTLVPKIINITNELVEGLGMYKGDGQTSINSKSYQATKFSNSHLLLIKKFIIFLNNFNIKPDYLTAYVTISKIFKPKNETQKEIFEKELISYWSKISNIPKQNFMQVNWDKKDQKTGKPRGNLAVIYSNSSFRIILDSLMNYIKKQALNDKKIASSFIKGLIAADGYVSISQQNKQISIAIKPEEDRILILKLLEYLGMKNVRNNDYKGKESLDTNSYHNFLICDRYNLYVIHPKKRLRFKRIIRYYNGLIKFKKKSKQYFVNHKNYMQPIYKSKILGLLEENPKTISELSSNFEIKKNALRRYIKILENEGKIKRINNYLLKPLNRIHKTGRTEELWQLSKEEKVYYGTPYQIVLKEIKKKQSTYFYELKKVLNFHGTTLKNILNGLKQEGKIISRRQKPEERRKHFPIQNVYEINNKLERK